MPNNNNTVTIIAMYNFLNNLIILIYSHICTDANPLLKEYISIN